MLTGVYFMVVLAFCLGSLQAYTIFDSLDNQESCPAGARRNILRPQHNTHYNIQQHAEQENLSCGKPDRPDRQFKPMQWLMRIIRIRSIIGDQPKQLIQRDRSASKEVLLHRRSELQSPNHIKKDGKILLILERGHQFERQPNHFIM